MNAYERLQKQWALEERWHKRFMVGLAGAGIAAALMFIPVSIVVEQRDQALVDLERTMLRLEEARGLCKRSQLTCTSLGPSSALYGCNLAGSRYVWVATEGSAALLEER